MVAEDTPRRIWALTWNLPHESALFTTIRQKQEAESPRASKQLASHDEIMRFFAQYN